MAQFKSCLKIHQTSLAAKTAPSRRHLGCTTLKKPQKKILQVTYVLPVEHTHHQTIEMSDVNTAARQNKRKISTKYIAIATFTLVYTRGKRQQLGRV